VTLSGSQIASLIVMSMVGLKLTDLIVGYFFKKVTRDDYITKKDCEVCLMRTKSFVTREDLDAMSRADDEILARLIDDMSTVKSLLLVMASKQGIPVEDLKGLVR